MVLPASVVVEPAASVRGRLSVPGDKSIAHRYVVLAALADGQSVIHAVAPGADCRATRRCLERLGVAIVGDVMALTIAGRGPRGLSASAGPLDAANSGTTARLLAGVLAAQPFSSTIVGDGSLERRPMERVIEPLSRMGAHIVSTAGRLPMTIRGAALRGIDHRSERPSAQVKSAVLLAGMMASGTTTVVEPCQTRNHTELAIRLFGGTVCEGAGGVAIEGGQTLRPVEATVPGDVSSAAFWCVAAAAMPGSRVQVDGVGLNPTRTALFDVLRRAGAEVDVAIDRDGPGEPVGTVTVRHGARHPLVIEPAEVPGIIDELPALAALAAHGSEMTVTGAAELRVKESDRISALVAGLRALGVDADEHGDGFCVRGTRRPTGGVAHAAGDHRLAMTFALVALGASGPSRIEGADAVDVSYPGFFETLACLTA